jgi:hypothetical protein
LENFKTALAYKGVLVALTLLLAACHPESGAGASAESAADVTQHNAAAADAAVPEQVSTMTGPQSNAVRSAKQYLSISGFSRDGLIQQLSSKAGDGYVVTDATAAVDSLDIDWNDDAARSAKQYLSISGFSCEGLKKQLSSSAGDKYTLSQATYGARQAGACS